MPLSVKWPYPAKFEDFSLWWTVASRLTMASVGFTSKVFTNLLNRSHHHNVETLYEAIEKRPKGTPLITLCNHHSCLDEPLIWGMLKWSHLTYRNDLMRWTTGASDVVFTKEWHSKFFALGQTIPLVRGDGVYQRSVDYCIELLNRGSWVHIFPEGKVNNRKNSIRLKWGIGRLISECKVTPIVIPFWQLGMDDVLPNVRPYRLKMFKKLTTVIGNPMDLKDTMKRLQKDNVDPIERLKIFTNMVQDEFKHLEIKAKRLHNGGDNS